MNFSKLKASVLEWALQKGILEMSNPLKQIEKTREELEETRDALLLQKFANTDDDYNRLQDEVKDGIGDQLVTLIILSELCGTDIEECLSFAYEEIKGRTGVMIDGIFVKDQQKEESR